jgi:hypothetical protein
MKKPSRMNAPAESRILGRPRHWKTGGTLGIPLGQRWTAEEIEKLDAWRSKQPDRPSRSSAIRRIVFRTLQRERERESTTERFLNLTGCTTTEYGDLRLSGQSANGGNLNLEIPASCASVLVAALAATLPRMQPSVMGEAKPVMKVNTLHLDAARNPEDVRLVANVRPNAELIFEISSVQLLRAIGALGKGNVARRN